MKTKIYPSRLVKWFIMTIALLNAGGGLPVHGSADTTSGKTGPIGELSKGEPVVLGKVGRTPSGPGYGKAPKPVRTSKTEKAKATNDPIRLSLTGNKTVVAANEQVELTITAQLLDIPSSLMFFTEEASSFRLKVILPAGFISTGGTFHDLVGGKLSLRDKPSVSYTIQGYFEVTSPAMCFRLLRGGGQADNSSLFVEKADLCLKNGSTDASARLVANKAPVVTPVNITSGDCTGITLSASVSPTTVNVSGQATLTASCAGCSTGGFNSGQALQFDGVDDFVEYGGVYRAINSTFSWEAWVNPTQALSNNPTNERYALSPGHGGNNGAVTGVGVAVGTNGIRVYEHTDSYLNAQLAYDVAISGWIHVAVVYTGSVPSLYVNGQFIKNGNASGKLACPSLNLGGGSYPGCFAGKIDEVRLWSTSRTASQIAGNYQQVLAGNEAGLVGSWRFEETGNTTINQVSGGPQGNLQNGVIRSSGISGGSTTTSYAWQALQGGSSIANPNAATTGVTVPTTAGNYGYQVTLTNNSCTTTQNVAVNVTGGGNTGDCYVIKNQQTGQYLQATAGNTVDHVGQANGQPNQIWKFETADGGLRISNGLGADKVAYVDAYSNDQFVRLGTDITGNARYRWIKEAISGTPNFRIRGGNMPWVQQNAGGDPGLQIWGDVTVIPQVNNPAYILYNFTQTTCPNNCSSPPTLSLGTPTCNGAATYSVSFAAQSGATITASVGTVQASQVTGIAVGTNVTITASLNNCNTVQTANSPASCGGTSGPLVANNCYTIQNLQANSYAQRQSDNTVALMPLNAVNNNHLWKAVDAANGQYRFVSQTNNADVLYVNVLENGQALRAGPSLDDPRYRWSLAASSNGGYRVYGGSNKNTWDQAGGGAGTALQLYGNETDQTDTNWDKAYRRFSFTQAACPTSGTCNLAAAASPSSIAPGATSTLTVNGGGNSASYAWKTGGNQIGTGASISVTPGTTTIYQAECTNCGGCTAGQVTVTVTPNPQFSVSPTQINWPNTASSQVVTVTSNAAWSVGMLPSWLTASSMSGSGNGSFTLSGQANTTGANRIANVSVSNGSSPQTISISQAGSSTSQPVYDLTKNYWYGYTIMGASSEQVITDPVGKQYIDASIAHGVNYFKIYLYWDEVQTGPTTYNWSYLDRHYAYALQHNMKVQVHLVMTKDVNPNQPHYPVFDDAGVAIDNFGVPSHRSNNAIISLDHAPTVAKAVSFVQTVANYLNSNTAYRDNLIGFSVCNSSQAETNYDYGNAPIGTTDGAHDVEYDWHPASIAKYQSRLQGWLGNDITKYNNLNGCPAVVTRWGQIMPPTPANEIPNKDYGVEYNNDVRKLWYLHRHLSLREFLASVYGAVHNINPLWNLMVVFPSLDANAAATPGNLGGTYLVPDYVNIIKINGTTAGDQNRVANLALRDRAPQRVYQNEMGPFTEDPFTGNAPAGIYTWDAEPSINQGKKCFEYDGTMLNIGGGTIPGGTVPGGNANDPNQRTAGIKLITDTIDGIAALYPPGGSAHPRRVPASNATNVHLSLYKGLSRNIPWIGAHGGYFSGPYKAVDGSQDLDTYGNLPVVVQVDIDILQNVIH